MNLDLQKSNNDIAISDTLRYRVIKKYGFSSGDSGKYSYRVVTDINYNEYKKFILMIYNNTSSSNSSFINTVEILREDITSKLIKSGDQLELYSAGYSSDSIALARFYYGGVIYVGGIGSGYSSDSITAELRGYY